MCPLHFPYSRVPSRHPRPALPLEPLPVVILTLILCAAIAVTLIISDVALAAPVISEVHWAGSDLSTSDEWLEISDSGGSSVTTMSGWTLTSVNSSGVEGTIFKFPVNAQITVNQYLIISHYGAAQSRLLNEPAFVASSISLPNSKLLLRLRDDRGNVIDQIDDGVGEPMAGENLSSPLRKSSMERIDLMKSGTDASNWVTATEIIGWKDGVTVMRGTPGFPHTAAASSSSSSVNSSVSSSSQAGMPALGSSSSISSLSQASLASSASSCASIDPYFIIQSGNTSGTDKVTINIQIGTRAGSLNSASCAVDFDDGTLSASCNPPSHTFDEPGSYSISADVKNACGVVEVAPLSVNVAAATSSHSSTASVTTDSFDSVQGRQQPPGGEGLAGLPVLNGAGFLITAVLPNPQGKDDGKEWVEITNVSLFPVSLEGWALRLPHAKKGKYVFGTVGFGQRESKRFLGDELAMMLPNVEGELSLIDPSGKSVSTLVWKDARDGVIIRPAQTFSGEIPVRVMHVVDGDTLDVELLTSVLSGFGRTERVRLIGIDAPEMHASDERQRMLAKRAAEFLRQMLEGNVITLTPGVEARDGYGRLLAYAETQDGDSVQEMILREGLAAVYLRYAFAKEAEFIGYQREAQEGNSGMWGVMESGGQVPVIGRLVEVKNEKLKVKNDQSSTLAAVVDAKESSASSRTAEVFHLEQASSRSKSSSSKKKSSNASRKRTVAVKKPPARIATVKKSSSASSAVTAPDDANMSPLFPRSDDHQGSLTADLLALRELIEEPSSAASEVHEIEERGNVSVDSGMLPFFSLGIAVSGTASLSGIIGWLLARRWK